MMNSEHSYSRSNLLLTGGTGFFGRSLLRHWLSQEQKGERIKSVCVLSRKPEVFLKKYPEFSERYWLKFIKGDILKKDSIPNSKLFTHLMHAATDSTLGPTFTPLNRYNQIVDGTHNMLEYAVENRIARFLLISSGAVYGTQVQEMDGISEDYNGMADPLKSENAYSVGKRCAEHICSLYQENYGIETVIARCFSFVGRDLPLDAHFAIGNFIRDAVQAREIIINSDGKSIRTYLDQRDLAVWIEKIMYFGKAGEAYNVGSDNPITIKELAEVVRNTIAPQKKVRIINQQNNNFKQNRYVPNIIKAKEQLKLKVIYSIEESIIEAAKIMKIQ